MKVEVMIYIYGGVCVSMILFNVVYNLLLKGSEPRMKRRCQKIRSEINRQLALVQSGKAVEHEHLDYLRHSLCHVNHLIAFHQVFLEDFASRTAWHLSYLRQIRPAILYIAVVYREKEDMQAAYFTYFLSSYTANREQTIDTLQDILLDYVKKPNLYCRFNALQALYHCASPTRIADAVAIQDDGSIFFHEKLLTEGLLSYTGDHKILIQTLWERFSSFSIHTQLAVLNYIRFRSGDYKEKMYDIMLNKAMDKELRLAAIRYFGKYHYEPSLEHLLAFVKTKDSEMWEYATVAAASLATYAGEKVLHALKSALHSDNWYIRYAAAQSLEHLDVDYTDLIDITAGNDRYAREMMMYRLESRKLQNMEGSVT